MTVLRSGSASDVGRVRTVNEDLALESLTLFAVADGMGGHVGRRDRGRAPPSRPCRPSSPVKPRPTGWRRRSTRPTRPCGSAGRDDAGPAGHGHDDHRRRPGGDRRRRPAWCSPTSATRVPTACTARISSSSPPTIRWPKSSWPGELSEEEAAVHPHRHILTRALGVQPDVDVDVWQLVPEEGDRFLLCSDGSPTRSPPKRSPMCCRDPRPEGGRRDPGPDGQPGRRQRQRHRGRA